MPVRRKNGRTVATSPSAGRTHGRLAAIAPVVRTRIDPGDPAERLAYAIVERHLQQRGIAVQSTGRAIRARVDRAREELARTPGGAEEARRITSGLTANGGALLRTVERAHVDTRPFAARAAVRFVALLREHDVQSTAALLLLGSAAQWGALAEMLRDLLFERGPGVLTSTKSMKLDDGGMASASLPAFGDVLKLAQAASNGARLDLLSALDVEQRARAERGHRSPLTDIEVAARLHAIQEERARRALVPAGELDDPEDGVDSAPAAAPSNDREPGELPAPLPRRSDPAAASRTAAPMPAATRFTAPPPPARPVRLPDHIAGPPAYVTTPTTPGVRR